MKKGQIFKAIYYTAVYKANLGGWRQEKVVATLKATSEKMAEVIDARLEQAGSKRQQFYVAGIQEREKGKKKRISTLEIIEA